MNPTNPAVEELARRLIAIETARAPSAGPGVAAMRVNAKLRVPLVKLVGSAGFRALVSRALAMAKLEFPSLGPVLLRPDGLLEGLDGIGGDGDATPGVMLTAHLLGLLVVFIGEPLTLRLVGDAWPDAFVDGIEAGSGEPS